MKAPIRDPGDFGVAYGTGPALELPEKAKSPRTPKRFRHMICFAFFEVGFIDGIVRISGALDLDVPLNGRADNGSTSEADWTLALERESVVSEYAGKAIEQASMRWPLRQRFASALRYRTHKGAGTGAGPNRFGRSRVCPRFTGCATHGPEAPERVFASIATQTSLSRC